MHNQIPGVFATLLYLFGLLLFLEWLYPIQQVTDTSNLTIFIFYAMVCFVISLLRLPGWMSILLKGSGLLFVIHRLFYESALLNPVWLKAFGDQVFYNLQIFYSQQWYAFSPEFRSLLFLVLIWLMSYLIHYWFVYVKRILLFVIMTFVYLSVLDVFTAYDSSMAIVRTFVFSFLALGMTSFSRVIQKEQIHFAWKKNAVRWLLPIVLIVSVASLVGYATPNKAEPKWPDPVPFLQGMAGTGGNGLIQKVGYGEDDSRLGGDFVQDETPVFQAKMKDQQYWRIESKETYTGKGWESSQKANFRQEIDGIISVRTFSPEVTTNTHDAMVHFVNNVGLPKLAYPYGVSRVSAHKDVAFFSEQQSGSIFTEVDQKEMNLQDYQVYYDEPSYPINEMQAVTSTDDDDVAIDYTQVPKELPERVHELAKEITNPYDNRYDKAKAVEQYFGKHGFTYQTEDVPVPNGGEDYVDQFLFESKRGYCDNYSSSMAVMLRTLGIPTRWVKGFSGGEKIADNPDGDDYDMYEITNSNAHSWVEVYFPNVGWVPFEPTQGFDNPADYEIQAENQENRDTLDVPANSGGAIPKKEEQEPSEKKQQQAQKETPQTEHAKEETSNSWLQPILIVGIAIAAILLAIWVYRKRWWLRTWFIGKSWQKKRDARAFQKTYQHLLKLLSHKGLPLEQGQTLHEFAEDVDKRYRTGDMRHLTAIYERLIYRNQFHSRDADDITQLWQNLIKQIGA